MSRCMTGRARWLASTRVAVRALFVHRDLGQREDAEHHDHPERHRHEQLERVRPRSSLIGNSRPATRCAAGRRSRRCRRQVLHVEYWFRSSRWSAGTCGPRRRRRRRTAPGSPGSAAARARWSERALTGRRRCCSFVGDRTRALLTGVPGARRAGAAPHRQVQRRELDRRGRRPAPGTIDARRAAAAAGSSSSSGWGCCRCRCRRRRCRARRTGTAGSR